MNLHRAVFTDKNILVQKHQQHGHSYGLVAVHLKLIRHYADFRLLMMQLPLIAVEGKVHQIVGCGGTECILYIAKGRLAVPQPGCQAALPTVEPQAASSMGDVTPQELVMVWTTHPLAR